MPYTQATITSGEFPRRLKDIFQELSGAGAGRFNRPLRQAIFLHVLETYARGNYAQACRMLGFNLSTAKMWYNPTSPVYTKEFVLAKDRIRQSESSRKSWRTFSGYAKAAQQLRDAFGLDISPQRMSLEPLSGDNVLSIHGSTLEKLLAAAREQGERSALKKLEARRVEREPALES